MNLWLFPIEPFEERYTAQWLRWFQRPEFTSHFEAVHVIDPGYYDSGIARGEFLDVVNTHRYKSKQLAMFAAQFLEVRAGDVVLLLDAWNPAVLQLAYMRDAGGAPFKIVGLLHAGTWDPHDYLTRTLAPEWARPAEHAMLAACDRLCVATDFHRELLRAATGVHATVTGFPLYKGEFIDHARPWAERPPLVVFPHRLAPEKAPEQFTRLAERYKELHPGTDVEFVRSRDVCKTKEKYYALLGRARCVVSTALQETWGIAMLEGAMLGAHPVVPERLSYSEVFGGGYTTEDEAIEHIEHAVWCGTGEYQYDDTRWRAALTEIARVCKEA